MDTDNNTFLVGHSIELRVPSDDDIENSNWHSWYNNLETTQNNMHGVFPIGVREETAIVRNIMSESSSILCAIYDLESGKLIGNAALQNIDLINKHCNIALTIGEGAPFTASVEVFGLLCNHAFMRLNLERVHDATHENLKTLVTMLSVIGFKEEGTMQKYFFRDNRWYAKINFAIFREDFIKLYTSRSGNILFENTKVLRRAIIDSVKASI